ERDGGPAERVAGEHDADSGRAPVEIVAGRPDEGYRDERVADGRAGPAEPEQPELPFSQRPEATDPAHVLERTPSSGELPSIPAEPAGSAFRHGPSGTACIRPGARRVRASRRARGSAPDPCPRVGVRAARAARLAARPARAGARGPPAGGRGWPGRRRERGLVPR